MTYTARTHTLALTHHIRVVPRYCTGGAPRFIGLSRILDEFWDSDYLWRLHPTNLTTLFTTKHYYTYGNVLPSSAPIMYRKLHRVILSSTPNTKHIFTEQRKTDEKKIGVETVIDVTNAKCQGGFLFWLSSSLVGRRYSTHHPQVLLLRTTTTIPCASRSIRSHRKSSKTSRSTPSRATQLAPHVSWRRSFSSIDDCTPPSRARPTRTSTRASLHVNSTLPRSSVDWVPERLRPGNWLPSCAGGACSLRGCALGLDVRWVS